MPRDLKPKGILRENKMLHAAIELFLKNGYEKRLRQPLSLRAGMSPSSFFASFESKEALLLRLVQEMFRTQFSQTSALMPDKGDPVLLYSIETSLQIHITELSEPLKSFMSQPTRSRPRQNTSTFILQKTTAAFADYIPDATAKDFYELELASSGITRSFMARPCDVYFTIEAKLRRYLSCCLTLYHVLKGNSRKPSRRS